MAQNLRKFSTYNEYSAATLVRPAVSWVSGTDEVYFDDIIPTPTCQPTNPNVWVTVDPSNFDFSQKVYQLDLGVAGSLQVESGINVYLYETPSSSTWSYDVSATKMFDPSEETEYCVIDVTDSSMQNVYSDIDVFTVDLCDILGSGYYLKAEDAPVASICDQEDCTSYDCVEWDEETGDCTREECTSYECVDSHDEYAQAIL